MFNNTDLLLWWLSLVALSGGSLWDLSLVSLWSYVCLWSLYVLSGILSLFCLSSSSLSMVSLRPYVCLLSLHGLSCLSLFCFSLCAPIMVSLALIPPYGLSFWSLSGPPLSLVSLCGHSLRSLYVVSLWSLSALSLIPGLSLCKGGIS